MAEIYTSAYVCQIYLIICLAFLIRSTSQSNNTNVNQDYNNTSEIPEWPNVLIRDNDSSVIAPNTSIGNNSYFTDEDDNLGDEKFSENNTTYQNSVHLKENNTIFNLLKSVTSMLKRSYQLFGVQKNKTYENGRIVANEIISENTTRLLSQKNSSYKAHALNNESLSNAMENYFTTERNRSEHKDKENAIEPKNKTEENVNLTRNSTIVGRSLKYKNNSTIQERVDECTSNSTSRQNSTNIESVLISSNKSFTKNNEYISAINQNIDLKGFKLKTDLDNNLIKEFIKISNNFSFKFYKFMSSVYPNFIFSPLSVSVLLSLILRASSGNSCNEIYNAIELYKSNLNSSNVQNSVEKVLNYFQLSNNSLTGLELEVNNGICLKDGTKISTKFLDDSHKYFGAKVKGINFKLGNKRTDNVIGKWIIDNTKSHLLRSKIMLDSFKADTNIVMFNNIFFSAQWIPDFQNSLIIKSDFYALGSRIIETQFIQKSAALKTMKSQLFKSSILEIPFHSDNYQKRFVFIIILPQNNQSIESVENEVFKSTDLFFRELSNMSSHSINVMIPQHFIHPECWRIDRILPHIGIKSVFQPETSQLTRISAFENMHISQIYHESYFEFKRSNSDMFDGSQNRELLGNQKSVVIESDFIANRPFLYLIMEKNSTALIFMAKVSII